MDHLLKKYEEDYSPWLGRPWKQQRGGGCFTLIYDYMKDTGVQEFSQNHVWQNNNNKYNKEN